MKILIPALIFAVLGAAIGALLAVASKAFAVPTDENAEKITELLPGANCGGCGYSGCAALASAISKGEAKPTSCAVADSETVKKISAVIGIETKETVKLKAFVMCSGDNAAAKRKYLYEGVSDCRAAMQLGGGDKLCSYGCIGLGTCVSKCKFDAIEIKNGVAEVNGEKCVGCGVCVASCPKHIIKLIPSGITVNVACKSKDKGAAARTYCDVGCIGCKMCEKVCPSGAITVTDNCASVDVTKCTGCGACAEKCPRKIIKIG